MSDDAFPHRLGPYRLERILGRGGMGVVYVAYDERLDRRVAVKRVPAGDTDPRRRERLRREARTAAQLAHPAVVRIFDLLDADGGDWIVMELVHGTMLSELRRQGPLDVDLVLEYGRQIAEGLAAAHGLGIVHRDLKTDNVMVLPDGRTSAGHASAGRVKILDFGLAKRLDLPLDASDDPTLSEPGQVMGTGRAMSPEQARGLEVGPRSDLFSFGVLLYETLTGISPFRAESFVETLKRVATHQPAPAAELAAGVPRELSDLVDRLLQKAPELRPASAHEVADTLARIQEQRRFPGHEPAPRDRFSPDGTATRTATEISPAADEDSVTARPARRRLVPGVYLLLALAAAVLALAAVYLPRSVPRGVAATEKAAGQARPEDPLEIYEEAMGSVRRIDRPESVERAVGLFQRLLERDGSSAAAHAGLARAYWEKARNASGGADPVFLEQAEAVAREAVRLDPYLADAQVSLGLVEITLGHHEEARHRLDSALELEPGNADAHYGLAKLTESTPEEAERHYRRAIELHPTPMYLDALGALLYHGGRYAEAEAAFLESLALAPDNVRALGNLGGLYYAQGRVDEAAARFQEALKIRPNASLYSNLGTIFFSRGLYPKAAAAFEDALETAGATHKFLFWLNLADAYRQMPDKEEAALQSYRQAIRLLGERIEAAPEDVRLLSRRALAQARAGARNAALADIARIRGLPPSEDVYSLFRLAVAEELCGRRDPALATLEEALRSGLALAEVRREPDLLELRADPRFHHLQSALAGVE